MRCHTWQPRISGHEDTVIYEHFLKKCKSNSNKHMYREGRIVKGTTKKLSYCKRVA